MRLVDGSTEYDGRVEICINQVWGSICSYNWDYREVSIVCKQLGYNNNYVHTMYSLFIFVLVISEEK